MFQKASYFNFLFQKLSFLEKAICNEKMGYLFLYKVALMRCNSACSGANEQ